MSAKASTLKSSIENFIRRQGIDAEMEQNLVKEAIHLHLLSAMSDAGILRYAVFQGGTALRLCYSGERYSEDLDFVCGKSGSYFTDVEFRDLIETALQTTKKTLSRDFGIDSNQISLKKPEHPDLVRQPAVNVAAWQIIVPVVRYVFPTTWCRHSAGCSRTGSRILPLRPRHWRYLRS